MKFNLLDSLFWLFFEFDIFLAFLFFSRFWSQFYWIFIEFQIFDLDVWFEKTTKFNKFHDFGFAWIWRLFCFVLTKFAQFNKIETSIFETCWIQNYCNSQIWRIFHVRKSNFKACKIQLIIMKYEGSEISQVKNFFKISIFENYNWKTEIGQICNMKNV